jgi:FKBP-type peptidyl-prolyl cis-trans isomerase FklB
MKKQIGFMLITVLAVFVLASCSKKYEAKDVELKTQNDSLNYTLGLANGEGIKNYYLQKDSSDEAIKALINALAKAYSSKESGNQMYQLGYQIGTSLKYQKEHGLMGDSTLVFDTKLFKLGLVNGLHGFDGGMTPQQAQEYLQKTMTQLQAKKSAQQAPVNQPQPAPSDQKTDSVQ